MSRGGWLAAAILCASALRAEEQCVLGAPCYTQAGIVNAASYEPGAIGPNTIVSIFGTNLSFVTAAVSPEDLASGKMPVELSRTGVRVLADGLHCYIYYVSPPQVNLLIPSNLTPTNVKLQLVRDGTAGPPIKLMLRDAAPGLFLLDATTAIATRADFTLITRDTPARPGEIVILWATGLGATVPPMEAGQIPAEAVWIARRSDFRVELAGEAVPRENLLYAGVAPGFAGLYQINLRLPKSLRADPEIRIAVGEAISPAGFHLPVRAE